MSHSSVWSRLSPLVAQRNRRLFLTASVAQSRHSCIFREARWLAVSLRCMACKIAIFQVQSLARHSRSVLKVFRQLFVLSILDTGIDVLHLAVGKRDHQPFAVTKTGQTLWLSLPAPRLLLMLCRSPLPLKTWSPTKVINVYVLLFIVAYPDELKTATGHVGRSI